MTPKERMTAFARGEAMDRIPIVPDMEVTMSEFIGATTNDYYTRVDTMVETEVQLFKRLRHDSVGISTTLRGMAEAMGSEMYYPSDNISQLKRPIVQTVEDIDGLKIIDPKKRWKTTAVIRSSLPDP